MEANMEANTVSVSILRGSLRIAGGAILLFHPAGVRSRGAQLPSMTDTCGRPRGLSILTNSGAIGSCAPEVVVRKAVLPAVDLGAYLAILMCRAGDEVLVG